jgi:DHA1 family tetracycline resistance protein-like MFS transporter
MLADLMCDARWPPRWSDTIVLPLPRSPLLPIFLIVCVDVLGLTIILPLLPFYAEHFGASPTTVGLLVSTFALCQLIGGPLLGRMSDHMGRRPLLLLSQAGTFIGFLILAYANALWVVFLSRVIDGITAGNLSLAQAYIADVTKPEERAKSFALIGIAFGLGFLVGPGISGFLSQFNYQLPILVAAGLSFTSILATWFLLPSTTPPRESDAPPRSFTLFDWRTYAAFFRRPDLAPLLWQFTAFGFAFSAFMSGFPLFAERRFTWNGHPFGPKQVGYVYAFLGFLGIILQGGLIGRLVKRFGEPKMVKAGFICAAVGFTILGFTYQLPLLLIVAALASAGTGILRPALTSLITQKASRSEQGVVLGLNQSLYSVCAIVAPFAAGLLINQGWLAAWALMTGVVSLIGLFIAQGRGRANS